MIPNYLFGILGLGLSFFSLENPRLFCYETIFCDTHFCNSCNQDLSPPGPVFDTAARLTHAMMHEVSRFYLVNRAQVVIGQFLELLPGLQQPH